MAASNIRSIGRATQGVRLIEIEGEDRAVSIARLAERDEERLEEKGEEPTGEVPTDERVEEPTDEKGEE